MKALIRICGLFLAVGLAAMTARAADISGTWTGTLDVNGNSMPMTVVLTASGNALTGTVSSASGPVEIHDGKLDGDTMTFWANEEYQGQTYKIVYHGKVSADSIAFDLGTEDGSWTGQFQAKREGGTPAAASADVNGQWKGTWEFNGNPMPVLFDLKSSAGAVTGTVTGMGATPIEIHDGKLDGDSVTFWINTEYQGQTYTVQYKGKVAGGQISFDFGTPDGAWGSSVTAKKV